MDTCEDEDTESTHGLEDEEMGKLMVLRECLCG